MKRFRKKWNIHKIEKCSHGYAESNVKSIEKFIRNEVNISYFDVQSWQMTHKILQFSLGINIGYDDALVSHSEHLFSVILMDFPLCMFLFIKNDWYVIYLCVRSGSSVSANRSFLLYLCGICYGCATHAQRRCKKKHETNSLSSLCVFFFLRTHA